MTPAPPILTTTRLALRGFRLDDAELMLAVWNTPEFLRFVADRGIRTEAAACDALIAGPIATWQEFGYGPFRVGLIDGPGIGICGLFRRAELAVPDLGVALLPEYYGQGYGGEAAGAVLRYCDEVLALPRVQAIVAPDNVASCAMLRRLDFISDGDIEIGDASIKLFSRTRPEVPAMN
ncbi:MAG: GNAT family N-acetyltransferase [Pseudomonadota bacterium]